MNINTDMLIKVVIAVIALLLSVFVILPVGINFTLTPLGIDISHLEATLMGMGLSLIKMGLGAVIHRIEV